MNIWNEITLFPSICLLVNSNIMIHSVANRMLYPLNHLSWPLHSVPRYCKTSIGKLDISLQVVEQNKWPSPFVSTKLVLNHRLNIKSKELWFQAATIKMTYSRGRVMRCQRHTPLSHLSNSITTHREFSYNLVLRVEYCCCASIKIVYGSFPIYQSFQ